MALELPIGANKVSKYAERFKGLSRDIYADTCAKFGVCILDLKTSKKVVAEVKAATLNPAVNIATGSPAPKALKSLEDDISELSFTEDKAKTPKARAKTRRRGSIEKYREPKKVLSDSSDEEPKHIPANTTFATMDDSRRAQVNIPSRASKFLLWSAPLGFTN